MAAHRVAILLVAASLFPATLAQGYGGVPQQSSVRRTTTTFAPDVIPSDQQAYNFHQQNPNPAPAYPAPAQPQFNPAPSQPIPAQPQYNPAPQGYPSNQGPLKDNSISGTDNNQGSSDGSFWWMNEANPFKGTGVPQGQGVIKECGGNVGCGQQGHQGKPQGYPAPQGKPQGYPQPQGNNPGNPFLSGGGSQQGPSYAPQQPQQQGPLTITCSGAGYLCVAKSSCNNGVVVNGGQPSHSGVQKCNTATESCCRLPTPAQQPSYPQTGGNYQAPAQKPNYPPQTGGSYPPQQQKNPNYPSYQGQGTAPGTNGVPIGGSIYDQQRPVTQSPAFKPYTGPLNVTPYPGCAAALKCVELIFCTAEGVMVDTPQSLTREQEENRVPLSECSNPETGILGKCCRDPNYKDPWPGGMMMMGNMHQQGGQAQFNDGQYNPNPTPAYQGGQIHQGHQQQHQQGQHQQVAPSGQQQVTQQPRPFPQQPPTSPQRPQPVAPQQYPQQPQQNFPQQQKPFPQQPPPQQNFPQQPPPQQNFPQQPKPFPQQPPPPPQQQNYPRPQPVAPQQPQYPQQNFPAPKPVAPQQPQQPFPRPQPVAPVQRPQPSYPQPGPAPVSFPQNTPAQPGYPKSPDTSIPAQVQPVPGAKCGVRRPVDRSQLPDSEAGFGEFPWHSMILSTTTRKPVCSGALVSDRAIVTAAHCVKDMDSTDILIECGVGNLGTNSGPLGTQSSPVAAIARHPNYDEGSQANDMAVLILAGPVQLGQHVDTLCLPERGASSSSQRQCVATGYGKQAIQANNVGSPLNKVGVTLIRNSECENQLKQSHLGNYFVLNQSFQCAVPTVPANDLCKVDAGAAIACDRGDGQHELSGVYSWDVGCAQPSNPTVFAGVDTDWIQSVLDRPLDQILREELNEVEKKKQSLEVVDQESKPGFSQGYGRK